MHGNALGIAWLKLQLREAALAVSLLVSPTPSLLSLSLFSYVFAIYTPPKSTYLSPDLMLHFSNKSIVFKNDGRKF
jgi:hypothetical protein